MKSLAPNELINESLYERNEFHDSFINSFESFETNPYMLICETHSVLKGDYLLYPRVLLLNHLNHSVLVETLLRRSIEERTEMLPVDFELSWMDPIIDSPREKKLPEEKNEAQRVAYRAARLMGDVLYKRSFSLPYLQCLRPSEADYVLKEVQVFFP